MAPAPPVPRQPSPATVALYNAVPNVLWSGLAWGPLVLACRYVPSPWLWWFVGVGLTAYGWPTAWLRRLQLSHRAPRYEQLGVPAVGQLAQQGKLVNKLLRRRYPGYRVLAGRGGVARLLRTTYQQERFHWAALLVFGLVGGYVGWHGHWGWALALTGLNVGYNLYPIWLQQYVRLRLEKR